jgi:hypothetical protein
MQRILHILTLLAVTLAAHAQNNLLTYAGGAGNERFNDVMQLSDGRVLVVGVADDLSWVPGGVPQNALSVSGIANGQGTGRTPFILILDSTAQTLLGVYHLPPGAAEDLRFIKSTNAPGEPTGDLYVSGNTEDASNGGYFIGRLDNNFVSGDPGGFAWVMNVKCAASGYPKQHQPWDVGGDGKVVYAYGDSHAYNWSAIYRQQADGSDDVVPHWRIHWPTGGGEYYGTAEDYPNGGISGIAYSGIVFKRDGNRCDLRSPSQTDYDAWLPDGNGGTKKGRWPLDVLYDSPCVPGGGNTTNGPGYTGYSPAATFTLGPSAICIDRRTNAMYIGFNAQSVLPGGIPDFEPAVMAMSADGDLLWWSRLYHEVDPQGDTLLSTPDQYVDALAIDYSQPPGTGLLTVAARPHGNNVENLWEGDQIAANPGAQGFQNRFTGSSGNIHLSWLGKLTLADGTLMHSTYVGELAEGATGLGSPHGNPLLTGWPDPNTGWPTLNTTYTGKNRLKVTADGSVLMLGIGRRTITTSNAHQQMVKPGNGGASCWNEFVRVYTPDLGDLRYSSLIVGQWDTLTQAGGDNVRLYGSFKTRSGVLVVGMHTGAGAQIPVANVPAWGNSAFAGESAVLAYFRASELVNPDDDPTPLTTGASGADIATGGLAVYPIPSRDRINVVLPTSANGTLDVLDLSGRTVFGLRTNGPSSAMDLAMLRAGTYMLRWRGADGRTAVTRLVLE